MNPSPSIDWILGYHNLNNPRGTSFVGLSTLHPPLSLALRIRIRPPDPSTTRTCPCRRCRQHRRYRRRPYLALPLCVCTITSIHPVFPPTDSGPVRFGSPTHTADRHSTFHPPDFLLNFSRLSQSVCPVTQQHLPHPHDPASPLPSRNPRSIANNVSASHWLTRIDTSSQSPTTHSSGYPRIRIPAPLLDAVIPTRSCSRPSS
jgi:hypothetical protein